MRGELYQNLIATLLIVLALASVSLVVNLSGLWWLWAPPLASLATLAAVFLREVDVPVGGRSPAEVRQALAAVLGTSAMVRAPREDLVTARLNALAAIGVRTRPRRARVEVRQVRRDLARPTVAGGLARTREGRGACVARGRPVDDPPHGPRSVRGAAESLHRFPVDHGDRGIHRVDCAARRPVYRPQRIQSSDGALGSADRRGDGHDPRLRHPLPGFRAASVRSEARPLSRVDRTPGRLHGRPTGPRTAGVGAGEHVRTAGGRLRTGPGLVGCA